MRCFVARPGAEGPVPVGMQLWNGIRPILEDRVIFQDRPSPHGGEAAAWGRASMDGRDWILIEPGIEEEWSDRGGHWVRHRALLYDPERGVVDGALYWVVGAAAG